MRVVSVLTAVVAAGFAAAAAIVLSKFGPVSIDPAAFAVQADPSKDATGAEAFAFKCPDGVELYVRHWTPSASTQSGITPRKPCGLVLLVHGFLWHSAYYQKLALSVLAPAGFGVVTFDLAAHGLSGSRYGVRGYHPDVNSWVDSIFQVAAHARSELGYTDVPVFLVGESMGGALALLASAKEQALGNDPQFAGLVLLGAASGPPSVLPPPAVLAVVKQLAVLLPRAPAPGDVTSEASYTSAFGDQEFARRVWTSDPLALKVAPIGMVPHILPALDAAGSSAGELSLPLLVIHGEADERVPPHSSEALNDRATGCTDRTLLLYERARHQMLQDQPEVTARLSADILNWLLIHTECAPARDSAGTTFTQTVRIPLTE